MSETTVWILGDQLLREHPALPPPGPGVVVLLLESRRRSQRLLYQRKKLVLLFSALRHYAERLRLAGYDVDYVQADSFNEGWTIHLTRYQPARVVTMAAASYDGRRFQRKLAERIGREVTVLPNTQFLLGSYDPLPASEPGKRIVMETFYRRMRVHFDVLMDGTEPAGGQWNLDKENRKKLPRGDQPPDVVTFAPDEMTQQVMAEVDQLPRGSGTVAGFSYAVTHEQADAVADQFFRERLHKFGDYEDALTRRSHAVYHSLLSPYLNLGLLTPLALVRRAEAAYRDGLAPLNAVEGFVRQLVGWREFMYWQYWRHMPELLEQNAWAARRPLPSFFWDGATEMACLRYALERAHATGYNHHIERLMLLCNFAMLAGLEPQAVNDWFLSLYIDAYDWVMPPNVIGMGLNADGGLIATKPYIASANYINKMGDHCAACRYNPRQRHGEDACPFNFLYWNFVLQHESVLRRNPRTSRNVLALRHLDAGERVAVRQQAVVFLENL